MAYINLLPWREEAKKAQQKAFFMLVIITIFSAITIVFLVDRFYQIRIDGQVSRNVFLNNEMSILDNRINKIKSLNKKKRALEKRKKVIEKLQHSRNIVTQVLDEIAKIVPAGIYFTRLEKQGDNLHIIGKSEANNHLANMIRAIERSNLLDQAVLESITSDETKSKLLSDFKMRVHIKDSSNTNQSTTEGKR